MNKKNKIDLKRSIIRIAIPFIATLIINIINIENSTIKIVELFLAISLIILLNYEFYLFLRYGNLYNQK